MSFFRAFIYLLTQGKGRLSKIQWNCVCVCGKITALKNLANLFFEDTYTIDFIVNTVAEVVDFFINFYTDNVIDKFAKKDKSKIIRQYVMTPHL